MTARALLVGVVLALASAAPASAERAVLVAYGTGVPTTCTISASVVERLLITWITADGRTDCDRAIQQSGQLVAELGGGALCSGFRPICTSSGGWTTYDEHDLGREGTATYEVTLRAPLGQGWIAPADKCSGAGTDNLRCTFVATRTSFTGI